MSLFPPPRAARWEPVALVPETPIADFRLKSYETGRLTILLRYSLVRGNSRDLLLDFAEVIAFRTFADGDGGARVETPRCIGEWSGYLWPLLEIVSSEWQSGADFVKSRLEAEHFGEPLHHYRIITFERWIDILARGNVIGKWTGDSQGLSKFPTNQNNSP